MAENSFDFDLTGMTCANCARAIERGVRKLPGVRQAAVNFAAAKLRVSLEPPCDSDAVVAKVAAIGYGARLSSLETGPREDTEALAVRLARRETLFAAALAVPVAALHMAGHHHGWGLTAQLLLATALQATTGRAFYVGAYRSLSNGTANMDVLVAMGTTAAWGFSVAVMALPALFPGETVFFETSALLLFFIKLGKLLEAQARGKASQALRELLALVPEVAHRVGPDGATADVPVAALAPGDKLWVKPGEKVPTDGVVLEGRTVIDESLVTGESLPVEKEPGSELTGATLNQHGAVLMQATRVGRETLLAQIVRLVEDAQARRAPIERFADRVSAVFVPAVIALAAATFIAWAFLFPDAIGGRNSLLFAATAATAVLVIACPCALGLATPTAILVGSGAGLTRGILLKNPEALEKIARIDTVLLDKTGTLTAGKPMVVNVVPAEGFVQRRVLELAVSVEAASNHPLARAVVELGASQGMRPAPVTDVEERAGHGLSCRSDGARLAAGSARWMQELGIDPAPLAAVAASEARLGRTSIHVAVDGRLAGLISVADPAKPEASEAIQWLRRLGMEPVMLTGDHEGVARAIAGALGIDAVRAGLLPTDKIAIVEEYQAAGRVVAMVGDGINDAAALAQADAGIAIGSGSHVAREAGDIVLVKSDLRDVPRAVELGRATLRTIKQNLFLSLGYNAVGIPLAAGVLYPWTGRLLPPEFAGLAMALSSVSVVANALRLRRLGA
ncbi:MAG: copper-translocating P-type ATPase [Candidatus Wallbacteria bacterium]|nr:copper-translocating P-type ATPase [Candidatus Wallbacteria bacterium]